MKILLQAVLFAGGEGEELSSLLSSSSNRLFLITSITASLAASVSRFLNHGSSNLLIDSSRLTSGSLHRRSRSHLICSFISLTKSVSSSFSISILLQIRCIKGFTVDTLTLFSAARRSVNSCRDFRTEITESITSKFNDYSRLIHL